MVQLRLMTDDQELGEETLALVLAALRGSPALRVFEPTRLTHRSGGLRVVLDVQPNEANQQQEEVE
ncbi:hypothetical protein DR950_41830 [Kitasatospora xanthocidica]|uniref:Uncharacterized protein n=1 Tax=Kitasatospora xanthocidica TaxID=83382 RepID=A0A372ZHV1_9ACTN|nr:hypothetical protein [Kitasatospora xanthocidica]RGD55406.1 hypothetical protein DR950_41830 [Kitasatospora xanthocidica]